MGRIRSVVYRPIWPLYHRDYENIGVTLHHINRGTDTGNTIAQGFPSLEPEDNEASLSAKNAGVAAELATRFLAAAKSGFVAGIPQSGQAKTYFFRDRKLLCDAKYLFGRKHLGHQLPKRSGDVITHFEEACDAVEPKQAVEQPLVAH